MIPGAHYSSRRILAVYPGMLGTHVLRFASNDLESIVIHRADILNEVEIWAPNLTALSLQESAEMNKTIRRD